MNFRRELWGEKFLELPNWPCPQCRVATLQFCPEASIERETKLSLDCHSHEAWDPDWITERFARYLECTGKNCGEGAIVTGIKKYQENYKTEYDGGWNLEYIPVYSPLMICPSPSIIHISEDVPDEVLRDILNASALVWLDPNSSANKLRLVTERILTALGINRIKSMKGNRRPIQLTERIDILKKKNAELGGLLDSIRFLGNWGSHEKAISIDRNDLLSAFEIMEHIIEEAFSKKKRRIEAQAKDLSKRKGRPRPKKR